MYALTARPVFSTSAYRFTRLGVGGITTRREGKGWHHGRREALDVFDIRRQQAGLGELGVLGVFNGIHIPDRIECIAFAPIVHLLPAWSVELNDGL